MDEHSGHHGANKVRTKNIFLYKKSKIKERKKKLE